MPFIGVVSNRTKDFDANPFTQRYLLVDAFGIGVSKRSIYCPRKISDENYPGLQPGKWVTVKYMINGPTLIFENLKEDKTYQIKLPTDSKITAWYPAIALRFVGDTCQIKDIVVK